MRRSWIMRLLVMASAMAARGMQAQALWAGRTDVAAPAVPVLSAPACVASGGWKGTKKTPVLSSADGHERMYGWLEWDRPGKWTGQKCEANWWVFASLDGGKFKPLVARQDFLSEGQQASLALAGFSGDARWAAADAMTTSNGLTSHGYISANLVEHTSCFGSAVKGLDGVRNELAQGDAPWLQQLRGIRDDGWLELSVHAAPTGAQAGTRGTNDGTGPVFEPCSGKVKIEAAQ